jgi:hypothetical protein
MKTNIRHLSQLTLLTTTFLTCCIAKADIVAKPDTNTLWHEDGNSAPTGNNPAADHWNGSLDISASNGILQLNATDNKNHSIGRYVKINPDYPYLVFHVLNYVPQPGYHAFDFGLTAGKQNSGLTLVSQINPGIYVFNLKKFLPDAPVTGYLRLDLYNGQLALSDLSMVKTPPNRIEITSPAFAKKDHIDLGDDITFTVYLEKKTEDASLTFYDSYTMPQLKINGSQTLQLKPQDADQKVWSATVKLKSIEGLRSKKDGQLKAFHLMVKALILGGTLKEPLWTALEYPIHLEKTTMTAK